MNQLDQTDHWEDRHIAALVRSAEGKNRMVEDSENKIQSLPYNHKIVINGYRNYEDVTRLREWLYAEGIESEIWYVETDCEKSLTQYVNRECGESTTESNKYHAVTEYFKIYESEEKIGCKRFREIASEVIPNMGTVEELESRIEHLLLKF